MTTFRFRETKGAMPISLATAGLASLFLAISLVLSPHAAFANESRYQGGNLECSAYPQIFTSTQSTAKGGVDHRVDNWNSTTQWQRVALGYSAFNAVWGWEFTTDVTGGFWSYGISMGGTPGSVVAGSLSRWCSAI